MERDAVLNLEATARLVGAYQWLEGRLFEVMGSWVESVGDPEAKRLLATQCHHHAWHAELWHDQRPSVPGLGPDPLSLDPDGQLDEPAPHPGLDELLATLAEPDRPDGGGDQDTTVEKLAGLFRVVVPRKITAYTHHLEATSTVADGPTIRALELILGDETKDWCQGESVLQSLIDSSAAARRAAAQQAKLEALLLEAGGLTARA